MRKRKERFLAILEDNQALCNHITGVKLESDYRNISWMTDELMDRILCNLSEHSILTSLEISGKVKTGVDGRHLHDTLFASIPPTITHIALNNIRGMSPLSFQFFRHVSVLRFTGVFTRAAGRQTLAQTLQNYPPQCQGLQPHPRMLEYSRQPKWGEEWTARSQEVLPHYVNLEQLEEADFQTYSEDDVSTLVSTLRAGGQSVQRLSINVSGLTSVEGILPASAMEIASMDKLKTLTLNTEYWEVYPIQVRPWQAVTYALEVLHCRKVESLTIVNHYGGRRREDWFLPRTFAVTVPITTWM
ncbi:hypothetical protein CC2G_006840 [Coprinopsis cinerea AmutBmut pab1-1]|nr:hypothetical protein CC2G_006840 [Coprinopsis cinerea AmutBmut pab1-1]